MLIDKNLSPADKVVGFGLACFSNADGEGAFPRMKAIAEKVNLPLRTVERSIARLRALGYLDSIRAFAGGHNVYTLHLPPKVGPGFPGAERWRDEQAEMAIVAGALGRANSSASGEW